MFSTVPVITEAGMTLLLKAASGKQVEFTRFQIGSGIPAETDPTKVTALANPLFYLNIDSAEVKELEGDGFVELKAHFDNQTFFHEDFRWTELGLWAKECLEDENEEVEQLYAYANDGDNAGLLKAYDSDVVTEQTFSVLVAIGRSGNITAYVLPTTSYVSHEEFEAHLNAHNNPHDVSHEQTGAAAEHHNHSADEITSGVLSIERGGTGVDNLAALQALIGNSFGIGFFTGDGALRRDIALGYKPSRVFLIRLNTGKDRRTSYAFMFSPGNNIVHDGCPDSYKTCSADILFNRSHGGAAVTDNGFAVGWVNGYSGSNTAEINVKDVEYMYIALR